VKDTILFLMLFFFNLLTFQAVTQELMQASWFSNKKYVATKNRFFAHLDLSTMCKSYFTLKKLEL